MAGNSEFIVPDLALEKRLGGGAFGSVWLGRGTRWSYSNQSYVKDKFAVKKIPKGEGSSYTEIEVHNCLGRHPNITYLYDWMEFPPDGDHNRIWLVYEFADQGSLNEILLKQVLDLETVLNYCQDIASAVVYMHQHRVVHLDIKADNILLAKTKHGLAAKICDFGISRILAEDGRESYKVTDLSRSCGPWYSSAPEVFVGSRLTDKSDIFSLGLIILAFFMRSHVKITHGQRLITPFLNYRGRQGTPLHEATQEEIYWLVSQYAKPRFQGMLNRMLQLDYHFRPFSEEVLELLERLEEDYMGPGESRTRRGGSNKRIRDNESIVSGGETSGMKGHQRRTVHQNHEGENSQGGFQVDDDWDRMSSASMPASMPSGRPHRGPSRRGPHDHRAHSAQDPRSSQGWGHPQSAHSHAHAQGWHQQQANTWGKPQLVQTPSGVHWVYPQQQQTVIVVQDPSEMESSVTIEEINDDDDGKVTPTNPDDPAFVYDATGDNLDEKMKQKNKEAMETLKRDGSGPSQPDTQTEKGPTPMRRKRQEEKDDDARSTFTARRFLRHLGPKKMEEIKEMTSVDDRQQSNNIPSLRSQMRNGASPQTAPEVPRRSYKQNTTNNNAVFIAKGSGD